MSDPGVVTDCEESPKPEWWLELQCLRCGCRRFMALSPRPSDGIYDVRCEACGELKLVVERENLERGKSPTDKALLAQLRLHDRFAKSGP